MADEEPREQRQAYFQESEDRRAMKTARRAHRPNPRNLTSHGIPWLAGKAMREPLPKKARSALPSAD
jgi:hypothetical protein